ncbi:MAG: hypothetical protein ACYDAI_17850 [Trichloromonadaceae bacterium]
MLADEEIALECPYCRGEIYRPLSWFKQPYSTCPACGGGLAAGQFDVVVAEIEEAFESRVADMVEGQKGCGCNCNH